VEIWVVLVVLVKAVVLWLDEEQLEGKTVAFIDFWSSSEVWDGAVLCLDSFSFRQLKLLISREMLKIIMVMELLSSNRGTSLSIWVLSPPWLRVHLERKYGRSRGILQRSLEERFGPLHYAALWGELSCNLRSKCVEIPSGYAECRQ